MRLKFDKRLDQWVGTEALPKHLQIKADEARARGDGFSSGILVGWALGWAISFSCIALYVLVEIL